MTGAPLLQLAGVRKTYGERTVLHPLDLTLRPGECVALMGPNGSGKSTLLRIAIGRDRPSEGTVTFDGSPLHEDDPRVRARIAVVADGPSFYPDLTARQHLQLVAVAHGAGTGAAALVDHALEHTRLTPQADLRPSALSSGQAQQLLLAASLVRPRDLLVLDEPEQRLDPEARTRLMDHIRRERLRGVAVVFATHHTELAEGAADRVLVLADGRLVDEGPPGSVLRGTAR
ncbi:ABC transporter ATP-binding protein [Streptomyces sp. NPDC001594]|uniref:ABC transporter ATP-binding protein n=1 Tax=Streptomyces sp. NPDC001594 TaxID=3364590 RepID=UPI0036C8967C